MELNLNTRDLGEFSELKFAIRAIENGFHVSRPVLSGLPYDLIVDNKGALFRVQIKSTSNIQHGKYKSNLAHGSKVKTAYTPEEIDFFGIHIVPLDLWYIIPIIALLNKKDFSATPENQQDIYHQYLERWKLFNNGGRQIVTTSIQKRTKGNIYTDQKCQICGSIMKYQPDKHNCFCSIHSEQAATGRYKVAFGRKIKSKRFEDIVLAEQYLSELRMKH